MKKTTTPQDMHPADVQAALRKKGWTFSKLSKAYGYCRGAACCVLRGPGQSYPFEQIIARVLGVEPRAVWPSRYNADGSPIRRTRTVRIPIGSNRAMEKTDG